MYKTKYQIREERRNPQGQGVVTEKKLDTEVMNLPRQNVDEAILEYQTRTTEGFIGYEMLKQTREVVPSESDRRHGRIRGIIIRTSARDLPRLPGNNAKSRNRRKEGREVTTRLRKQEFAQPSLNPWKGDRLDKRRRIERAVPKEETLLKRKKGIKVAKTDETYDLIYHKVVVPQGVTLELCRAKPFDTVSQRDFDGMKKKSDQKWIDTVRKLETPMIFTCLGIKGVRAPRDLIPWVDWSKRETREEDRHKGIIKEREDIMKKLTQQRVKDQMDRFNERVANGREELIQELHGYLISAERTLIRDWMYDGALPREPYPSVLSTEIHYSPEVRKHHEEIREMKKKELERKRALEERKKKEPPKEEVPEKYRHMSALAQKRMMESEAIAKKKQAKEQAAMEKAMEGVKPITAEVFLPSSGEYFRTSKIRQSRNRPFPIRSPLDSGDVCVKLKCRKSIEVLEAGYQLGRRVTVDPKKIEKVSNGASRTHGWSICMLRRIKQRGVMLDDRVKTVETDTVKQSKERWIQGTPYISMFEDFGNEARFPNILGDSNMNSLLAWDRGYDTFIHFNRSPEVKHDLKRYQKATSQYEPRHYIVSYDYKQFELMGSVIGDNPNEETGYSLKKWLDYQNSRYISYLNEKQEREEREFWVPKEVDRVVPCMKYMMSKMVPRMDFQTPVWARPTLRVKRDPKYPETLENREVLRNFVMDIRRHNPIMFRTSHTQRSEEEVPFKRISGMYRARIPDWIPKERIMLTETGQRWDKELRSRRSRFKGVSILPQRSPERQRRTDESRLIEQLTKDYNLVPTETYRLSSQVEQRFSHSDFSRVQPTKISGHSIKRMSVKKDKTK